jgi:peptidase E
MMRIVAIAGGGFSVDSNDLAVERYLLALTGKERPRVCFVPTASGDSERYLLRFYRAFGALEVQATDLSLFQGRTADLAGLLGEQDVIYVGGGNTRSMLALWREWGLEAALRQAGEAGAVLCGVSAGAICWFQQGVTDSVPGQLGPLPALGWLPGSYCPHYDSEPGRRPIYQALVASGELLPGLAADDGVALHYVDGALQEIIASRATAQAYRLEPDGQGGCVETPLPARRLEDSHQL